MYRPGRGGIKTLPKELIILVFSFYTESTVFEFLLENVTNYNPHVSSSALNRYKLRHVCRLWRNIILQCPLLNTDVVLAHPDCVEDQIRVSAQLPLSVYIVQRRNALNDDLFLQSCRIIFLQAHRIHSILLRYTATLAAILRRSEFISLDFPNIRIITEIVPQRVGLDTEALPAYSPFARMDMRALRSYTCNAMSLPILLHDMFHGRPPTHTLRSLNIRFGARLLPQSVNVFFDVLNQLGLLEILRVRDMWPLAYPSGLQQDGAERTATLPHLRNLSLQQHWDSPQTVISWLPHFICPPTTCIDIHSSCSLLEDDSDFIGAQKIAARFAGNGVASGVPLDVPVFMKFTPDLYSPNVCFSLWTSNQLFQWDPISLLPPPLLSWSIGLNLRQRESKIMEHVTKILEILQGPLTSVTGLLLTNVRYWTSGAERSHNSLDVLRLLSGVRVLGVEGVLAFKELTFEMLDNPTDIIFPHLQCLHIHIGTPRDGQNCSLSYILYALERRKERGSTIPVVNIVRYPESRHVGEADLAYLASMQTGENIKYTYACNLLKTVGPCPEVMRLTRGLLAK